MPSKIKQINFEKLRPSEYMRARRPELFSDTKIISEPRLSREILEYHLETLTNRKQEYQFEHFSRLLAEKELCPNLLPQTGPTGGGDSKVDTETYPVAEAISIRWYEGVAQEASKERWAFAFSAKKDWRQKVKSDVKGIINTERDYKLIYFITNQFVRDKERAKVEDDLKNEHDIDVRILDRSWIVERVFKNNHIKLTIEALNLTDYDEKTLKICGLKDIERERDLKELDEQINDVDRYIGIEYQLAEDCLRTALIARGLELPRLQIEGRFLRAERIAERVGHRQQQLRIAYNKAWTAFWWYEDFSEFNELYNRVESFAVGSSQASDLELLTNLWQLLKSTTMRGKLDPKSAKLDIRTKTLKDELERLASDKRRPNNALNARTNRLLLNLIGALNNENKLNRILKEFSKILDLSECLIEFPIDKLINLLNEFGNVFPDNKTYDELFEKVIALTEKRTSEGETGCALLRRGWQKLNAEKRYDAIKLFGRAQSKLAKHEYRSDFFAALAGCGLAYEQAGLLWAARTNYLLAANQAISEYWKHGEFVPQILPCLNRLIWVELQLGRVPFVLAWIEFTHVLANQILKEDERKIRFNNEKRHQDGTLSLLVLKTAYWDLKWLGYLPQVFDDLGLDFSWIALLFSLGYEDKLRKENIIPNEMKTSELNEFFTEWTNQPAKDDLPENPEFLENRIVELVSIVLGSEVIFRIQNNLKLIQFGETILGALEAFLATSIGERIFPFRSNFKVIIKHSDFHSGQPIHKLLDKDGESYIEIQYNSNVDFVSASDQKQYRSFMLKLLADIISQITVIENAEYYLEKLVKEESVFDRTLGFAPVSISMENLLGVSPKFRISDWTKEKTENVYALKRETAWNEDSQQEDKSKEIIKKVQYKPGSGKPPKELFDFKKLRHKDIGIASLINPQLWKKAKWRATVYLSMPNTKFPPLIALGFKNEEAAKKLFGEWYNKIGKVDEYEKIRISIITGIDKKKPSSYYVCVSHNPNFELAGRDISHLVIVSQYNRMDPADLSNLDRFLRQYKVAGKYAILPALITDTMQPKQVFYELAIEKKELNVLEAWKIGPNDPDVFILQENIKPIIPPNVINPPFEQALKQVKKIRANKIKKRGKENRSKAKKGRIRKRGKARVKKK